MTTNMFAQPCYHCGHVCQPGEGRAEKYTQEHIDDGAAPLPMDSDPGWYVFCLDTAACKARIKEYHEREAAEAAARAALVARKNTLFCPDGLVRPQEQYMPDGIEVKWDGGFTIYGTGEEFVVTADQVWHLIRNSADGDNWSLNNVAGVCIGYVYPATPERLEFLRGLDPEAFRSQEEATASAIAILHAESGLGENWPVADAELREADRVMLWTRLPSGMHIGASRNRTFFLIGPIDHYDKRYLYYDHATGRDAEFNDLLSPWVFTAESGAVEYGRYTIGGSFGGASCSNNIDALQYCLWMGVPVDDVKIEPGVMLEFVSAQNVKGFNDRLALWSDGFRTKRLWSYAVRLREGTWEKQALGLAAEWPTPPDDLPTGLELSEDAIRLYMMAWHGNPEDRKAIQQVVSCEEAPVSKDGEEGYSSHETYELFRLDCAMANGKHGWLWRVEYSWSYSGPEDADADVEQHLFPSESSAREFINKRMEQMKA